MTSDRTPAEIAARATALSCAGCHALSSNANLGGGVTWPASLGVNHVTEQATETGPDGPRYKISDALTGVFLKHRSKVLSDFIVSITPVPPCQLLPNCCGDLVCWYEADACPVICIPREAS
jgi:hypothetical protein